jgi:hypothetical protein
LNIEVDFLADKKREEARCPNGARPNWPHWPVKEATLVIQEKKVTSSMKQDGKMKGYIIKKEKWTQYTFDSVAWREYEIAYKRLSKSRQVNMSTP